MNTTKNGRYMPAMRLAYAAGLDVEKILIKDEVFHFVSWQHDTDWSHGRIDLADRSVSQWNVAERRFETIYYG